MKRIIVASLVVLMALIAVIVQRQVSDDRVVLVGYGNGAGWGGTDYITASAEQARDTEAVELAIQQLYDAINTYDSDLLQDLSVDPNGNWEALMDDAESAGLTYNVDIVSDPSFDGDTCEVEVTTTSTFATDTSKKSASTETIRLVRQNTKWAVE